MENKQLKQINVRISQEDISFLLRACKLLSINPTSFIRSASMEKARMVIRELEDSSS